MTNDENSLSLSLSLSSLKPKQLNRVLLALALAAVMAVASILPVFAVPEAGAAAQRPTAVGGLYAWGQNAEGAIGQGNFGGWHYDPIQVGDDYHWVDIAVGGANLARGFGNHTLAINNDGYLYAWGWNEFGQLGLGDTNNRHTPTRVGNQNNWAQVSTRGRATFAINEAGELWAWGDNANGLTGTGLPAAFLTSPTRVGTASNWVQVDAGDAHAIARNSAGQIFTWGRNDTIAGMSPIGGGMLGTNDTNIRTTPTQPFGTAAHTWTDISAGLHTTFAINSQGQLFGTGPNVDAIHQLGLATPGNRLQFTQIGIGLAENWVSVEAGANHGFAINDQGQIYAWGSNQHGRTAQSTPGNPVELGATATPQPIQTPGETHVWTQVIAGDIHTLAIDDQMQLFVWGNSRGAGLSTLPAPEAPSILNPIQVERNHNWFAAAAGWQHSVILGLPIPPVTLTKTLQMPEGTTPPDTDTFTFGFRFVPRQIELTPQSNSRPIVDFPAITPNPVELALDGSTVATANTVTTITGYLDLMDIFGGLTFPGGGVFVWEVYEVDDSSGLTDLPNYEVIYDTSRFQVRVHVTSAGSIGAIEVFELDYNNGVWELGDKVGGLTFVNTYRKLTGPEPCPDPLNGIEITKNVVGEFADLTTDFTFTLTLTEHFLAPLTFPIDAYIIDIAGNETSLSIPAASHTFTLRHGERLVIPQIWAGTNFAVNEHAAPNFIPSFRVTVGGTQGSLVTGTVNTALATGTHIVWDTGRNAADYINTHEHTPPTGLVITTAPWLALVAIATLLLALFASSRNRKRIEELPMVF